MPDGRVARVEDREEVRDQALGGAVDPLGVLLCHPFPEVVEVGLHPQQRVAELGTLGRQVLAADGAVDEHFLARPGLGR